MVPPWYELPPEGYGGVEAMCAALVDKLAERGHDVTVFGAGRHKGAAGTFVSTVARPQQDRLDEVMPAVLQPPEWKRCCATPTSTSSTGSRSAATRPPGTRRHTPPRRVHCR